jgi:hypothetical protein
VKDNTLRECIPWAKTNSVAPRRLDWRSES